ncbi:MAG TPA: hypothetical protein VN829_03110 [Dongiaceae bacterium]|nr:hypothetical protein [Dongiaceae bacterium]
MKTLRPWMALTGVLAGVLVEASAQTNGPPVITGLRPSGQGIAVTVAVPDWGKQVTLESRTNAASGVWSLVAWKPTSSSGTITLEADSAEPAAFFRAHAYAAPSFLDRVTFGFGLIKKFYPEAVLYEVEATGTAATSDPTEASQLTIVCDDTNSTVTITSADGFTFDPVQYLPGPWLEDVQIPWPVSMDVMEADILLQAAGWQGTFWNFTLRYPLYPGIVEPYYIFGGVAGVAPGHYVFVGVNDKKVFVSD